MKRPRVLLFATQGAGGSEETRIRDLLQGQFSEIFPFDRSHKVRSFWRLLRLICSHRPALVVMEGTGLAGGLALLLGRLLAGVHYVVSSGDAVGPWVGTHYPLLGPLFGCYERILCCWCAGFIGWTPYLAGRAMTFGAPRAITAAGWAPYARSPEADGGVRSKVRKRLGIPEDALVMGIAGALIWNRRVGYCYGAELVRAAALVRRPNFCVLIVGDGTGKKRLEQMAGEEAGRTVFFTGRVPQSELPDYFAAMDVSSLPQSVDSVGNFRYTTKLSEYLAARLPVVTGQISFAYDLDSGWLWRLPGKAPWSNCYIQALAALIDHLTPEEIEAKRCAIAISLNEFDRERQVARATAFIRDILE
jgi:hypothetical protein